LRRKGTTKGVRLIDLQSLLNYINAHVEPGCAADKPQELNATVPHRKRIRSKTQAEQAFPDYRFNAC
jgi:hypothetical protein